MTPHFVIGLTAVRPLYQDTSVLINFPSPLGESPYVIRSCRTVIVLKPTLGLAVRLAFKYKGSLLNIVGRMSCWECQY